MGSDSRKLQVVDLQGREIGIEDRAKIHADGLLHKEVHVWFYTPNKEIIFQHRSKEVESYPDLLDATVGGHVEIGDDYETTAVKEIEEETGMVVTAKDLVLIGVNHSTAFDDVTQVTNNVLRAVFAMRYSGSVKDLKPEVGKSEGFEKVMMEDILNFDSSARTKYIDLLFSDEYQDIFRQIQERMDSKDT